MVCSCEQKLDYVMAVKGAASIIYTAAEEQRRGLNTAFAEVSAAEYDIPHQALPFTCAQRRSPVTSSSSVTAHNPSASAPTTDDADVEICSPATSTPQNIPSCPTACTCKCHHSASLHPIPYWLSPWLGHISFSRPLPSGQTLKSSKQTKPPTCNEPECKRTQRDLTIVKWLLPTWFAKIKAEVEFATFPIYFVINTPRLVEAMSHLILCSVDDFRRMLSTREVTLHDMDQYGWTVICVCHSRMYALTALIHYHNDSLCFGVWCLTWIRLARWRACCLTQERHWIPLLMDCKYATHIQQQPEHLIVL